MKRNNTFITILILFIICKSNITICQNEHENLLKYWYYRDRLKYFVVPENKIGESQIICVRNKIWAENDGMDKYNTAKAKSADYGQHGKYQGYYIGVLATEYYLLNKNGQYTDAANTENELFNALNAIKVYWDEQAESYWSGWSGNSDSFNGFFIRGNVPCDFFNPDNHPNGITGAEDSHLSLLNSGISTKDTWL